MNKCVAHSLINVEMFKKDLMKYSNVQMEIRVSRKMPGMLQMQLFWKASNEENIENINVYSV